MWERKLARGYVLRQLLSKISSIGDGEALGATPWPASANAWVLRGWRRSSGATAGSVHQYELGDTMDIRQDAMGILIPRLTKVDRSSSRQSSLFYIYYIKDEVYILCCYQVNVRSLKIRTSVNNWCHMIRTWYSIGVEVIGMHLILWAFSKAIDEISNLQSVFTFIK